LADEGHVRFGRPRPCTRLATLAVPALVALLSIASADAAGFKRDETPLPASITDGSSAAPAHVSSGSSFARLFLGLIVVVVLIFAVRALLRRTQKGSLPRAQGDMAVIATTPLAPNRAVHLLRVGDELVLVGSAEQGVTQLRVYDADEARALLAEAEPPPRPTGPRSLSDTFQDLKRRTAR
jgi:flagellar protein FliO/FliZ